MAESVVEVATRADLVAALGRVVDATGAVALAGGADFTEPERLAELRAFFAVLAGYLERTGTAVVDGGTDSGVMRLIAEARRERGGTFPLIGVAPVGAFDRTTRTGAPISVAPDHSLIVLVPGREFGDETAWLFDAADHLATDSAPTIVVNGGRLTLDEAHLRLGQGHLVVVVAGTGRGADELADDEGLRASGRLRVIPVSVGEADLAEALEQPRSPPSRERVRGARDEPMTAAPAPRPSSSEKLGGIIDALDITPFQKEVLRQRWLDQVTWMGRQARSARRRYSLIRIPTVIGGVLVPGLISILLATGESPTIDWLGGIPTSVIRVLAFVVSLAVAILAATEDALRYADRWRHYRRTAELLKTLGWQYLGLNGAFRRYRTHADAFAAFSERVEDALNEDVEGYLSAVSADGSEKRSEIVV